MNAAARRLDRETILAAATGLVDAEGLAQLTMRRLGSALGVEAMSLYRYFPSRLALLEGLIDSLVLTTSTDPQVQFSADDDWTDYLHRLAHGCRQMALTHPRLFPLVATHPTEAPWIRPPIRSLRWVDSFLAGLLDHHFPPVAAVAVYKQFSTFLLGNLLLEVAALGLDIPDAPATTNQPVDPDRDIAEEQRRQDAVASERAMPAGPDVEEVLEAADGATRTTADEPAVIAAEPTILATARAAGVAGEPVEGEPAVGVVAEVDIPIVAAVVSTGNLDLREYPNVASSAGLLAQDTALRDFDRQLSLLIDGFAPLRRA